MSVIEFSWGEETEAKIAQLGERMTEDHKVRCSIHLLGAFFHKHSLFALFFSQLVDHKKEDIAVAYRT